jgi:hypothetical protein
LYIPQESITDRVLRTARKSKTSTVFVGLAPMLESVAAIVARSRAVTRIEQS